MPYALAHAAGSEAAAQTPAPLGETVADVHNPVFSKGKSRALSWDDDKNWLMDDAAFQFFGGEIHPSRIPHQYWEHRIQMVKALGCNTISLYIMWNFHERPDGSFDFCTPDKDIGKFIDLCAENGMWVILRSGPYVCAEWDFGGLPPRMLADPQFRTSGNLQIRLNAYNYMTAVKAWNKAVYENVVKGRTLAAGGPIMLLALENEYTSWSPTDPTYIPELAKQWTELGYSETFCVCEGWANAFTIRDLPLPPNTAYGMTAEGSNPSLHTSAIALNNAPTFGAECYPGWLTHWAESNQVINIDSFATGTIAALAQAKRSLVIYVAHGGTNFGFTAGSNGTFDDIQPDITSYDYGAPISEAGLESDNFYPIQAAYVSSASYDVPFAPVPAAIPAIVDGEVQSIAKGAFRFRNFLKHTDTPIKTDTTQSIEWMALYLNAHKSTTYGIYPSGIAIYRASLPAKGGNFTITFERPLDYAIAYVNDMRVEGPLTTVTGRPKKTSLVITSVPQNAVLTIVSMPFGRCNFAPVGMLAEGRGLMGKVFADGKALTGWSMNLVPMTAKEITNLTYDAAESIEKSPFYANAIFKAAAPKDMYVDMTGWGTGYVFVNGRNLGRYWTDAGPQKRLYCPGVWLNAGENSIVVFELTQGSAGDISFYAASGLKYSRKAAAVVQINVIPNAEGYYIQNVRSKLFLQSNSGVPALEAANASALAQAWNIASGSDGFKISNKADQSSLALNGSNTERWLIKPVRSNLFTLTGTPDNVALEAMSTGESGIPQYNLIAKPKSDADNEWPFGRYWYVMPAINGVYYVSNKATNQRLSVNNGSLLLRAASNGDDQKWRITLNPTGGNWSIVNVATKQSLDVADHKTADNSSVGLWASNGGSNQLFLFVPRADGTAYAMIGAESGAALTMKDTATNPTIWNDVGDAKQSWVLTKAG